MGYVKIAEEGRGENIAAAHYLKQCQNEVGSASRGRELIDCSKHAVEIAIEECELNALTSLNG